MGDGYGEVVPEDIVNEGMVDRGGSFDWAGVVVSVVATTVVSVGVRAVDGILRDSIEELYDELWAVDCVCSIAGGTVVIELFHIIIVDVIGQYVV